MDNEHESRKNEHDGAMKNHYTRFVLMIVLMFVTMYVLMFVMVDGHSNVNQFQMTVLMTAPMVLIEIVLMNEFYRNRNLNLAIVILSIVCTIGCWFLIREQTTIFEALFRNSQVMPNSAASMVSHESAHTSSESENQCGEIVRSQQKEIEQLKDMLNRMEHGH